MDEKYIAAGCLVITAADSNVPPEFWCSPELRLWKQLEVAEDPESALGQPKQNLVLWASTQGQLMSSRTLRPFTRLLRDKWIRLEFAVSLDDDVGIVRVYLLPEDVDRGSVDRSAPSLGKAWLELLSRLDYSHSTWCGEAGTSPSPTPRLWEASDTAASSSDAPAQSILHMFNNIPSPDPKPENVQDEYAREAMCRLLDSDIVGLKTLLYPYQRRSAAMMLQRESQPHQHLDPRLVKAVDHRGRPWYYDSVGGVVLGGPRMYHQARGGILAEEMGSGKTLICLALILATRHLPSQNPDFLPYQADLVRRPETGSLMDMAAASATGHGFPWRDFLEADGVVYRSCIEAIHRNPASYHVPPPQRKRVSRRLALDGPTRSMAPTTIFHSHASLVVVPPNLLHQWKLEIGKHTWGLKVVVLGGKEEVPSLKELLRTDLVLFSYLRLEKLMEEGWMRDGNGVVYIKSPLTQVQFKRCIVDEGHRLGTTSASSRSNLHTVIEHLRISSRWIMTGTPSKGLYGVDQDSPLRPAGSGDSGRKSAISAAELERDDLKRIGSIAAYFLKVRPWANTAAEPGDTPADWSIYVMQPKHSPRSAGREDCLKSTLESLILRHRLSEVSQLLPVVNEKVVYLDGSFQDRLSINLFSMIIICNAVQSQRTDQDYFFNPRQKKFIHQLVANMRQATFFGGSFFSPNDLLTAIEVAEKFLAEGKVTISPEDDYLLRNAIQFGHVALNNRIKTCANTFHEIPLYVKNFPAGKGREWSLDHRDGDPVCTDSRMVFALQKFLRSSADAPNSLKLLFESGRFEAQGKEERSKALEAQQPLSATATATATPGGGTSGSPARSKARAGNIQPGPDSHISFHRPRTSEVDQMAQTAKQGDLAACLAGTQIISTASAKLSYLIDQIVQHQHEEQIIVFYENANVGYYLSGMMEVLQIQHLIYSKTLTAERRSQYVSTFNHNPKFRVLLMDINQAAFGLDVRSASRIYFVNPVLNPQVEAQAIGRARRISQKRPVTVETLVLKGSFEELIIRRRGEMTPAEQRKCRSILDDRPIREWILNAKIAPMPDVQDDDGPGEMARLKKPQFVFGRGFGRQIEDPDQDLVSLGTEGDHLDDHTIVVAGDGRDLAYKPRGKKRKRQRVAFA